MSTARNRSVVCVLLAASPALAQINNLRMTEVDVANNQTEIFNIGPTFVLGASERHPFCARFSYFASITNANTPGGTFPAAAYIVYTTGLNNASSDHWLYDVGQFFLRSDMIHGVQYGAGHIGRTGVAFGFGLSPAGAPEGDGLPSFQLWSSVSEFAPTPVIGETLAWDGFGFTPRDWYIDATPTMGGPDSSPTGVVSSDLTGSGTTEDFESISLGDEVNALTGWMVVTDPLSTGRFTVRAIDDVAGQRLVRSGSTSDQWLRIRDQDGRELENRMHSNTLNQTPGARGYVWTFFLALEESAPAGAANQPRLAIQHGLMGGGFADAWGLELIGVNFNLVTVGVGGPQQSAPIGNPLAFPLNQWLEVSLSVDFVDQTVSASIAGGAPVVLNISPSAALDPTTLRFGFRGSGAGNTSSFLLDDVSFDSIVVEPQPCPGDANGDGLVTFADITSVLSNWLVDYGAGSTGPGDANQNGLVEFSDITEVLSNWLNTCP